MLDAPGSLIIQEAGNRTFSMQTALHELLGELEFPDFRAGYDAML